jgi:hypothetical protein
MFLARPLHQLHNNNVSSLTKGAAVTCDQVKHQSTAVQQSKSGSCRFRTRIFKSCTPGIQGRGDNNIYVKTALSNYDSRDFYLCCLVYNFYHVGSLHTNEYINLVSLNIKKIFDFVGGMPVVKGGLIV